MHTATVPTKTRPTIVILDEADGMIAQRCRVLPTLIQWACWKSSNLALVTLGESRFISEAIGKLHVPKCRQVLILHFAYQWHELLTILSRLI